MRTLAILLTSSLLVTPAVFAANYKCQGADGKIEYSDRPCDNTKAEISPPKSATPKTSNQPMERLQALFGEYEERLCEREKLSTEMDIAHRTNAITKAPEQWKPKQERLSFLNDTLIEFQGKASRITQKAGADSDESKALRKFQSKLKDCGKLDKPAAK
jgi:hypothetical protein